MSCYGDGYKNGGTGQENNRKIVRLLCSLCKRLEAVGLAYFILEIENGQLSEWWNNHKKLDAEQEARKAEDAKKERLRSSVLSYLTDKEKEFFNLKKK